jgi:four helix bundle protein
MNNFKDLKTWHKGMEIVKEIYTLARQLPDEEKFSMKAQLVRSAISIPSNIAEGTSRKSSKDFARFHEIALGSCFELETQVLIAKWSYPTLKCSYSGILNFIQEEQKMLQSFSRKIYSSKTLPS